MKRILSIIVMATVCLSLVGLASASEVNFTGTWVLDRDKSDPVRLGGRRGGGGGQGGDIDITLVITQSESDLKITRTMSRGGQERSGELAYTLDGKENTNSVSMGRLESQMTSKSSWSDQTLVIEGTQQLQTQRGDFEIGIKEEYSLSADGKVLTIVSARSTPRGDQTSKQLYNKQ